MFLLRRPSRRQVQQFEAAQRSAHFSYGEVGATRTGNAPQGYAVDRAAFYLGSGEGCFRRARQALGALRLFEAGWITLQNKATLQEGETLVLLVRHLGFYSLIANRVVYTVDEPRTFGYGYGTLTGHAEQGEERFLVCLDENGAVTFELFAFSRPRHPLARLGNVVVRGLQRRAARAYARAMRLGLDKE